MVQGLKVRHEEEARQRPRILPRGAVAWAGSAGYA